MLLLPPLSPEPLPPSGAAPCVDDRPQPETQQSEERKNQRYSWLGERQWVGGHFSAREPAEYGSDNAEQAALDVLAVVELTQPREYPGQNERNRLRPSPSATDHGLFDHLIRTRQHRGRDRQAESLRRLQVDGELEPSSVARRAGQRASHP
jgi:hypothetical protein